MKFYVLASVIIFCMVIRHAANKSLRDQQNTEADFWARERRANSVRRKSLEGLPYITIPLDRLPLQLMNQDPEVASCIQSIRELSQQPIVNLTGYSNTDLKLEYGTANITALSQYDQSYTLLASTLQKWADILWNNDYHKEAADICSFAVSTHTDVGRSYYLLSQYLISAGRKEEITELLEIAKTLRSANKEVICQKLTEYLA